MKKSINQFLSYQNPIKSGGNVISYIFMIPFFIILFSCSKDGDREEIDQLPRFGTCNAVTPNGRLNLNNNGNMTYVTSGGGEIKVDGYVLTISRKNYSGFTIQFWGTTIDDKLGGNHENLNGKHIKDWEGRVRSIIFPDGAKITMNGNNANFEMLSFTIYNGKECHHINKICNTLEYSSANSPFTQRIDDAEIDGETGTFKITSTGLLYFNIYTESTLGQKIEKVVNLGEIYKDNPTRVDDYYPS